MSRDVNLLINFCKAFAEDGEQSYVSLLQIYPDKSVKSLRATRVTCYPNHFNMLNFMESARRNVTFHGSTVVAYLPISL